MNVTKNLATGRDDNYYEQLETKENVQYYQLGFLSNAQPPSISSKTTYSNVTKIKNYEYMKYSK